LRSLSIGAPYYVVKKIEEARVRGGGGEMAKRLTVGRQELQRRDARSRGRGERRERGTPRETGKGYLRTTELGKGFCLTVPKERPSS